VTDAPTARSPVRRVERFLLGIAFAFAAWIVERRVLKAIRKRGEAPPRAPLSEHATSEIEKPRA
jgi:hypothetical protein